MKNYRKLLAFFAVVAACVSVVAVIDAYASAVRISEKSFVAWVMDNPFSSDASGSGVIHAVSGGSAQVTATSGSHAASVSVSVADEEVDLAAALIQPVQGDNQQAEVATVLGQVLIVEVRDTGGNALSGVPVEWVFGAGGGFVGGAQPDSVVRLLTDVNGQSAIQWRLGTTSGTQAASARIVVSADPQAGDLTNFSALGSAGAPAEIIVAPTALNMKVGETAVVTAVVVDQYGNVVDGATVTWSSSDATIATVQEDQPAPVSGVG